MGLSLSVGMLADLLDNDAKGAKWAKQEFANINRALKDARLPLHNEPTAVEPRYVCDMWGYGGLHLLRRIAAYQALGQGLPAPGARDGVANDPVVEEYYAKFEDSSLKYKHLMLHSDAEGYYLPFDFEDVLFPRKSLEIAGGMIGSSLRLRAECLDLAALLGVPPNTDPDSEEVFQAVESQGEAAGWLAYGVESYVCLRLLGACEASIKTGAVIVFC
jgi:hypothetical protein